MAERELLPRVSLCSQVSGVMDTVWALAQGTGVTVLDPRPEGLLVQGGHRGEGMSPAAFPGPENGSIG